MEMTITPERRPAMVTVRRYENRPKNHENYYERVLVSEETRRALVHTTLGRHGGMLVAELEDGHMELVRPKDVRFLDSAPLFDAIRWEE